MNEMRQKITEIIHAATNGVYANPIMQAGEVRQAVDAILALLPQATEEVKECKCGGFMAKWAEGRGIECNICHKPLPILDDPVEPVKPTEIPLEWPKKKTWGDKKEDNSVSFVMGYNDALDDCLVVHLSIVAELKEQYEKQK